MIGSSIKSQCPVSEYKELCCRVALRKHAAPTAARRVTQHFRTRRQMCTSTLVAPGAQCVPPREGRARQTRYSVGYAEKERRGAAPDLDHTWPLFAFGKRENHNSMSAGFVKGCGTFCASVDFS